ncbi:hypothetical protein DFH09DRAFT_1070078 [Mycena vulgaris]|nr:hypothetical protein DFH09DRAFT_1070078 [Mycena vulgaris]
MPLVLAWLVLLICIVQVAIARILLSNTSSQPSQDQFPSDGSILFIASAMGQLSDEWETSDEGITQGFLRCGLGSPDGVGLPTNSGINNTGIDAVYASLLWYLFVDTNATSGAEGYRMYCTPTSNGTRIVGHDDSAEKLLTVAVGPQANLTSEVETEGRTYRWNITQIEFHTYPPFGIPQRLYTENTHALTDLPQRQRKLHHDRRGTLAYLGATGGASRELWAIAPQPLPTISDSVASIAVEYADIVGKPSI